MAAIRLNKQTKTIKVVNRKETIKLEKEERKILLEHVGKTGPQGPKGDKGDQGAGIPIGGNEGQVLQKKSNDDYDFSWTTPSFEDKNYTQSFTVQDDIIVAHNLAKYPALVVIDSAGDEVEGSVTYLDTNSLRIRFAAPFSGTVICN